MKNLTTPLVSVVIPVYNGEKYLEAAVKSVLENSYKNIEILLIDDGSTKDNSVDLCRKLASKYPQIRFYPQKTNRGLGNVLNFALKKAVGKYICRLNQDDLMLPTRIQTQLKFLQDHPQVVAVGSYLKFFNQTGDLETIKYGQDDATIRKTWYFVSPFADPAVMYHKDAALKVGGYNQNYWPAEDLHLWYRLSNLGQLANITKPLTRMRLHDSAASNRFFRRQIINTFRVHYWADKNLGSAPLLVKLYWLVQLCSGLTLGAKINWFIYKRVKSGLGVVYSLLKNHQISTPKFRVALSSKV